MSLKVRKSTLLLPNVTINMIELHVLRVFNKANYAKTSAMINLVCDL